MAATILHITHHSLRHYLLVTGKGAADSFTEFLPFCSALYFFSSYKNFQQS